MDGGNMNEYIERTMNNLTKNGFNAKFFDTKEQAVKSLLDEISLQASVGIGGSVTIDQLGIYEDLLKRGNQVHWHHKCQPEEKQRIHKYAAIADVYLSGTNAITVDGTLINIDGVGNRVVNMAWGHDKIIIIAGVNKISKDYSEGIQRIKTIACPKNAERLNLDVPCRHKGECTDCRSPQRMCRITTIIERQPMNGNIHVYLINEELGY